MAHYSVATIAKRLDPEGSPDPAIRTLNCVGYAIGQFLNRLGIEVACAIDQLSNANRSHAGDRGVFAHGLAFPVRTRLSPRSSASWSRPSPRDRPERHRVIPITTVRPQSDRARPLP